MSASNMEVAKTILAQMGGAKLSVMTGANSFAALESGLRFKVPMKTKNGANMVQVRLTPEDLYDMEFFRVWGNKVTNRGSFSGVYADQLVEIFEGETGLYLSF